MAVSARIGGREFDGGNFRTSGSRWEYEDMRLPLQLGTMRSWFGEQRLFQRVAQRADAVIERHVERLGSEGWQPDEPVSFVSLYKRNRVDASYRGGLVGGHDVREVTIRFKRLAA